MKKKIFLVSIFLLITITVVVGILLSNKVRVVEYKNKDYSFSYDTTWELKEDNGEPVLSHKKSKALIKFKVKELTNNFIDMDLSDIVVDLTSLIEKQNPNYKMISSQEDPSDKYDSFEFLYEYDNEQALVYIYKKDTKLVTIYYTADSKYYDIVLDSVDSILGTLLINNNEE